MSVESRIQSMGLALPAPQPPSPNLRDCVRMGNYIFTSGHVSQHHNGDLIVGKIGKDLTVEEGYKAAQGIALCLLASLKEELGDLSRIKRIVKLTGFVNCVDGFTKQPAVMNGATDVFIKVFGDANGRPARSALGINALPFNVAVEIEAIVELHPSAGAKSAL